MATPCYQVLRSIAFTVGPYRPLISRGIFLRLLRSMNLNISEIYKFTVRSTDETNLLYIALHRKNIYPQKQFSHTMNHKSANYFILRNIRPIQKIKPLIFSDLDLRVHVKNYLHFFIFHLQIHLLLSIRRFFLFSELTELFLAFSCLSAIDLLMKCVDKMTLNKSANNFLTFSRIFNY